MMRLKVNGVEEEFAVTTVSELLAFRGVDPVARFVAFGCGETGEAVA